MFATVLFFGLLTGCSPPALLQWNPIGLPWTPKDQKHLDFRNDVTGAREVYQGEQLLVAFRTIGMDPSRMPGYTSSSEPVDWNELITTGALFVTAADRSGAAFTYQIAQEPVLPTARVVGILPSPPSKPNQPWNNPAGELLVPHGPEEAPTGLLRQPLQGFGNSWYGNDPFSPNRSGMNAPPVPDATPGDAAKELTWNGFYHAGEVHRAQTPDDVRLQRFLRHVQEMVRQHLFIYGDIPSDWPTLMRGIGLAPYHYTPLSETEAAPLRAGGDLMLVEVGVARTMLAPGLYQFVFKYTRTPPGKPRASLFLRVTVDYQLQSVGSVTVLEESQFPRARTLIFHELLVTRIPTNAELDANKE